MFRTIKFLPVLLFLISNVTLAATVIEVEGKNGRQTRVMVEGDQSRIDMGAQQGYVLTDYKKHTMLAVVPQERQILDMSGDMPSMGGKPAPKVKTKLVAGGAGPNIAGYPTKKYTLIANDTTCGSLFGSKEALEITGINKLFESMKEMAEKQRAAMGGYASMMDDCSRAKMSFASQSDKVGVPMKMLDANGRTVSEIKSIKTNVSLPANTFTLPQGYKTITMADQMSSAMQGASQTQRQTPDMQKMMKQMQQSERMPPEAIEQMKRYQEMMQQQGR